MKILPSLRVLSFAVLMVLCASQIAAASSITTLFASNNGYAGNMFDVTVFSNPLTVTAIDVNAEATSIDDNVVIELYIKTGSYVGYATDPSAWTLVDSVTAIGAGVDNPTLIDVTDFALSANTLYGFYVHAASYGSSGGLGLQYTNGSATYSNADLQLDLGIGRGWPVFSGSSFEPRIWNGTIYYDGGVIPEPSSLLLLGTGLGVLWLGVKRRRRE